MITVTYLENGIRNTRTCDFICADNSLGNTYAFTGVPTYSKNLSLVYFDGADEYSRPLWRKIVLHPGSIIESVSSGFKGIFRFRHYA